MNKLHLLIVFMFSSLILTNAQSEVDKMLKDIKGNVDEIVIKSEGKTYTYSGDEAQKIFSAIKKSKEVKSFTFTSEDGEVFSGDSNTKKIIIKKRGDDSDNDDSNVMVWIDGDSDSDEDDVQKIEKKVIVSTENDKKVVTVTTVENGEETTEIYEGKAADEYLDKMKSDDEIKVNVDVKVDDGKKVKKIIIEKEVDNE